MTKLRDLKAKLFGEKTYIYKITISMLDHAGKPFKGKMTVETFSKIGSMEAYKQIVEEVREHFGAILVEINHIELVGVLNKGGR